MKISLTLLRLKSYIISIPSRFKKKEIHRYNKVGYTYLGDRERSEVFGNNRRINKCQESN